MDMNHLDKNMNNTDPQEKKQWVAPELVEETVKNTEAKTPTITETTTLYAS
jgi:hypothetical protein